MSKLSYNLLRIRDFYRPNRLSIKKFIIKDDKKHPFAIICPGGGYYINAAFVEGDDYAKELNKLGINCFIIYYRVREKAYFPNPVDDVAKALKCILEKKGKYNLIENYAIFGSSAGGHLAGMFARGDIGYKKYNLPKPNAAVLVYPVVTLYPPTHEGTKRYILGKNNNEEMIELLSLEKNITKDYPKTYFMCGKKDSAVNPIGSLKLKQAFDEKGIEYIFRYYDDLPHGAGIAKGTEAENWIKEAVDFWLKDSD